MMKKRVISTGLFVGLSALIAGLSIHLMKAEGQGASPYSSTLQSVAWPTPWLNLSTPSLSVSRSEVGHWVDNMPQLHDRATNARRLRRQGLRALANQRPCAAGMVLRRSFELEPWPREIAEHLENLELAYRQCGWVREAEDLGRVSITYFPTSYRAYVAEKELARPEQTPAFHPMFQRWEFATLFRVLDARELSSDVINIRSTLEDWRRELARFAGPNELARARELAQYSDAPRLARFFHRVQRQRFIDSGHNFEWHQRSMRTSFRSLAQRAARRYGVPYLS